MRTSLMWFNKIRYIFYDISLLFYRKERNLFIGDFIL